MNEARMLSSAFNGLWKSEDGKILVFVTGYDYENHIIFYTLISKDHYPVSESYRKSYGDSEFITTTLRSIIPNRGITIVVYLDGIYLPQVSTEIYMYIETTRRRRTYTIGRDKYLEKLNNALREKLKEETHE